MSTDMDPRKSATVTAPDLMKAFNEGRGVEPGEANEQDSKLRFYVLFKTEDEIQRADYAINELQAMLAAQALFFAGGGMAVAVAVHENPPDGWEDYPAISAADD